MALSNAERQKRYRERRRTRQPRVRYRRPGDRRSRPGQFLDAIATVMRIHEEYHAWRQGIVDSFQDAATTERLDDVLTHLDEVDWEALLGLDLPKGYGRD